MSEYGSTPPRDPRRDGEHGPDEQDGRPSSPGQPGQHGQPGQYGQPDQSDQSGQGGHGQPQYGQSAPSYGQSAPSYGQGQSSQGQGQPPYGQSQSASGDGQYGQGQPSYGQGQPSYGQGQSASGDGQYGQGSPSYGQSQPSYGQSQPSYGQGQPPYGQPAESGAPEQHYGQGQYGQNPYGQQGQYGQQPAYGDNPYGQQPAYGSFGQQPYGAPMGGSIPSNIEFASMGRRLAAFLLDALILGVAGALLGVLCFGLMASGTDLEDPDALLASAAYMTFWGLAFVGSLAYQIGFVALRGATPGKMILGIRIVRTENGQVPGWVPAILRWLVPFVGSFVCGIGQFVVYLSPFFDSSGRRQGWHDMAAKTVVIKV